MWKAWSVAGFVIAALVAVTVRAQTVVPPLPLTGPYPVGCTNIEQDLSRVPVGDTADMYWRGVTNGEKTRYVDTLLASPADVLKSTFAAPNDVDLYDRWAGTPGTYVFLACYPTTAENSRADYVLPGNVVVPRM